MNFKNNIHEIQNNNNRNNRLSNTRFVTLKTASNTSYLESAAIQSSRNDIITQENKINFMKPPAPIIPNVNTIQNSPNIEQNNSIRNPDIGNTSLIKQLNNFILEKIFDKEFVSNIAKNFVKEMMKNKSTDEVFKQSLQKNFNNFSNHELKSLENKTNR
jgi:hypothetical protein